MKETYLKTLKNVYEIVFSVSNIYDNILNEIMNVHSDKDFSNKDLLLNMAHMTKNVHKVLAEAKNIHSNISESIFDVEREGALSEKDLEYFSDLEDKVSDKLVDIAKDAIEALDILLAYIIKTSSADYTSIKEQLGQRRGINYKELLKNLDILIQEKEEELYNQLLQKIKINIININKLIEVLKTM